ncbi:MAG: phosphate ABC transporter substrate-binding protein [Phascolarctobacterium sp.]|nr:phosphate ABC transporter substrate-binding protein [Phascolarctobacterium sp.]
MKKILCAVLTSVALFGLVGCGGSQNATTGKVATDGSTSMEKVIGALGESFQAKNKGITFTYNPTGSGAGITAVQNGRCDIGLSSRNLKQAEKDKGLQEQILARDGIAIVVNPENNVKNLSVKQLSDIYTGKIKDWQEVGGKAGAIVLIGREAGSGTRDGFESITKTANACKYRQELTSTGDVITTVSSNPAAIGYASLASVKKTVKALSIDNVAPSSETIKNGSYPVQRPFVLVTKKDAKPTAATQKFFDFLKTDDAKKIITKAGVVPEN